MDKGDSIVLPYPRDTVAGVLGADINFVCRQINDRQYQYWKL